LLPLLFISGELDTLTGMRVVDNKGFWLVMTITGVFGFLINIASFLQIKYTSALSHNLSGTAKACLQTVLSVIIWQNPVSFMNGLGIFLVIVGSFWYSQIRYTEMQQEKDRLKQPQSQV